MLLLAESIPPELKDPSFNQWLVNLFLFGLLIERLWGWLSKARGDKAQMTIHPQPIEVTKAREYVTREEFTGLKEEMNAALHEVAEEFKKLNQSGADRLLAITNAIHLQKEQLLTQLDERLARVYDRMNASDKELAGVKARQGMQPKPRD